jgi:hypothetical protein
MLNFYQFLTKDQYQQIKSQALSRNMKNKWAPYIMMHSFLFHLRRNCLSDALSQIDRAIQMKLENEGGNKEHEGLIDFYLKRA